MENSRALLAVPAVSIDLSGPRLFIKPLMLFLWCPGPHQSPPHVSRCPLLVLQVLPESIRGLSPLWMSERTQSLFGYVPSPVTEAHM